MNKRKFGNKIVKQVKKSLGVQKLQKVLQPLEYIEHRDRYYAIKCRMEDLQSRTRMFLRYEKWFFYIPGLTSLPPELPKREYVDVVRSVKKRNLKK